MMTAHVKFSFQPEKKSIHFLCSVSQKSSCDCSRRNSKAGQVDNRPLKLTHPSLPRSMRSELRCPWLSLFKWFLKPLLTPDRVSCTLVATDALAVPANPTSSSFRLILAKPGQQTCAVCTLTETTHKTGDKGEHSI